MAASSRISCQICMDDDVDVQSATTIKSCGHSFCTECIQRCLEVAIKDGQTTINCPLPNCKQIDSEEIKSLTSEELFAKYERFCRLKANPDIRECPQCGTETVGKGREITCGSCQTVFCFVHGGAHLGKKCREYEKKNRETDKASEEIKRETTKNCPSCRSPIERAQGCYHMHCTRCGTHFCWICGSLIADGSSPTPIHYASWNLLGCAGKLQRIDKKESRAKIICSTLARYTLLPVMIFFFGIILVAISPIILPIFIVGKIKKWQICSHYLRFFYAVFVFIWKIFFNLFRAILALLALATLPLWIFCLLVYKFRVLKSTTTTTTTSSDRNSNSNDEDRREFASGGREEDETRHKQHQQQQQQIIVDQNLKSVNSNNNNDNNNISSNNIRINNESSNIEVADYMGAFIPGKILVGTANDTRVVAGGGGGGGRKVEEEAYFLADTV